MHDNGVTLQKKVLQNLDIPYSYELAKRMEQYRSHPTLGYRPAGSKAEFETGEMLKTEMEKSDCLRLQGCRDGRRLGIS